MTRIVLIIITLSFARISFAQYSFSRSYNIDVTDGANYLDRAWEGGLNYPIFSNIDFNNDDKMDLVAFDKSGERLLLFDHYNLKFQPFNKNLVFNRWVLFRDFNCDGLADIFTGTAGGIRVYKNTGDLNFVLEKSILKSDYINLNSNLYVSNTDIPGIVDIDGDGDLDILTFEINGARIELHKNLSMEQFNNCNQLSFKLNSKCWGEFTENPSTNDIYLNQPCAIPYKKGQYHDLLHAGSTITTLDQNKDGDIEIIIGDIAFNNLIYLNNGGTTSHAVIDTISSNFPSYSKSIDINTFPYASYADVDFDGKPDLITVSNNESIGDNKKVVLHKNVGVQQDTFSFESSQFLIDEMLDFGAGAYPVLIDEDQDGLLDILIGNSGENSNGNKIGKIALLRNIGTNANPSYKIITYDYLNLSAIQEAYLYPAVGDIDGDGDDDLFVGLQNGKIAYYNNTANMANPCIFVLANGFYNAIDVGSFSAPQLFDINNDNLLDLIIGEQNGTLTYYPNGGTSSIADFSFKEDNFGGITTQDFSIGAFYGYSTPHFFKDRDTTRILVGSENGGIYYYQNMDSLQMGNIKLTSVNFENTKDGDRSAIITHDLNKDNYMDLFIGNLSGGLAYHQGIAPVAIESMIDIPEVKFTIHNNQLELINLQFDKISVYSISGKLIKSVTNNNNTISIANISKGIYVGVIQKGEQQFSFKLIKFH